MGFRLVVLLFLALSSAGCMSKKQAASMRTGGEAMPVVEVKPGYASRIALMDQYRLHDEMRHHLMHRPHVTVEELTPEEVLALPPEDEEAPRANVNPSAALR